MGLFFGINKKQRQVNQVPISLAFLLLLVSFSLYAESSTHAGFTQYIPNGRLMLASGKAIDDEQCQGNSVRVDVCDTSIRVCPGKIDSLNFDKHDKIDAFNVGLPGSKLFISAGYTTTIESSAPHPRPVRLQPYLRPTSQPSLPACLPSSIFDHQDRTACCLRRRQCHCPSF